ncbi:MAG: hypothetical protein FWE95_09125, partial [Planctomycetaceae bacterium]|nr:hypothetical protein [Planctomycetaceae bacterium]
MKITRKHYFWQEIKIANHEFGLHFVDDEFKEILKPGTYRFYDPKNKHRVEVSSQLLPWLHNIKLEEIIFSGKLKGLAEVIDLKDDQRGIVWVDGRCDNLLMPGRHGERFLKRGGISLAFLAENWQNPFFDRIFHALTVSPRQSYR